MTKDKALILMHEFKEYLCSGNPIWDVQECAEAFDMVIEALEDRPTGQWIVEHDGNGWNDWSNITCPLCGTKYREVSPSDYKYCPHCGARMK